MYLPSSSACTEPNSATPISAERIAAQNRRVGAVGADFFGGNRVLDTLIVSLGGNSMGQVPGAVSPSSPFAPGGEAARNTQNGGGGSGSGPNSQNGGVVPGRLPCAPKILPFETVFPIPVPVPQGAPSRPVSGRPAPPPVVVVDAGPVTPADCRTGNICADIRSGCVQQAQVTQEQLLACSMAGWGGNQALYPQSPNAPFLGSPDLNPPRARSGVSGVAAGDLAENAFWAGVGLLAFTAWAVYEISKGRR